MFCSDCNEEVDEVVRVQVGKRTVALCEDCAETRREQADAAESAVQGMMEYKGRR